MGSGEVAIVALSTMISLKVTFSDGLGGIFVWAKALSDVRQPRRSDKRLGECYQKHRSLLPQSKSPNRSR